MNEFIDKNGITKLTWAEYKRKGDHLRKTKGFTAKQIKDLYGKPVIDGVVIEITTGGPNTIRQRSAASRAKSRANRKRKTGIYKNVDTLPTEIKKWAAKLTKENKWPEGKSLEGFIQSHESAQKKLMSDIEHLKNLGFIDEETGKSLIDDGHLIAIGSEQKVAHPLRPKGTHGSHHGEARVPELSAVNQAKREAGDIDFLEAKRGGIITDDLDAFSQYLTDDAGFGPGVKPTTVTKQRIAQGAKSDQAIEKQIQQQELFKQRQAYNKSINPQSNRPINNLFNRVSSNTKGAADVDSLIKIGGFGLGITALRGLLARPDLLDILTEEQGENLGRSINRLKGGENAMTVLKEEGLKATIDLGKELVGQIPSVAGLGAASTVYPGVTAAAAPVIAPVVAATIPVALAKTYSGYLKERTGEGLGEHYQKFRDKGNKAEEYLDAVDSIGTHGTVPHILGQGKKLNPIQGLLQNIKNRTTLAAERFDPSVGEFGLSELIHDN